MNIFKLEPSGGCSIYYIYCPYTLLLFSNIDAQWRPERFKRQQRSANDLENELAKIVIKCHAFLLNLE